MEQLEGLGMFSTKNGNFQKLPPNIWKADIHSFFLLFDYCLWSSYYVPGGVLLIGHHGERDWCPAWLLGEGFALGEPATEMEQMDNSHQGINFKWIQRRTLKCWSWWSVRNNLVKPSWSRWEPEHQQHSLAERSSAGALVGIPTLAWPAADLGHIATSHVWNEDNNDIQCKVSRGLDELIFVKCLE